MEQELEAGVRPDRIAFLSFTRAAREEALSRAGERFGYMPEELPYFRTLHSIAYRERGAVELIKGPAELKPLADALGLVFTGKVKRETDMLMDPPAGGELGDRLLALDHFRRHNRLDPFTAWKRWDGEEPWFVVKRFFDAYEAYRKAEDLLDFTDLLEHPHEPLPVDVVIVDEAQDLSRLQWWALARMASRAERVYLAGDDDQAIFVWAGASAQAFLDAPADEFVVLDQSYRLPRKVHRLAESLTSKLRVRWPKVFKPREEEGVVRTLLDPGQVEFPSEGSCLVLYRNHYLGSHFEAALRQDGEPYTRNGQLAAGLEMAGAVEVWRRLTLGKRITTKEARTLFEALPLERGLERGARAKIRQAPMGMVFDRDLLQDEYGMLADPETTPWEVALRIADEEVRYLRQVERKQGDMRSYPRIRLSTIHASKGSEAEHVILLTDVSRKVRDAMERDPDDERRVFYVGATRAKQTLTLVGVDNPLFT